MIRDLARRPYLHERSSDVLSPDELRDLLDYDPASGLLTWKRVTRGNLVNLIGREACARVKPPGGYKVGIIAGREYYAHRVIWALVHGEWPKYVDHIDGNKLNNRLSNLRSVDAATSARNMPRLRTNRSGVSGVSYSERRRKWHAYIQVNRRKHHVGFFENFSEAGSARQSAQIRFGFHPNHGRSPYSEEE